MNNSIVHFEKKGNYDSIEAVAIRHNNANIIPTNTKSTRLYKNRDYKYYSVQYSNALRKRNIGIWITGGGIGLFGVGLITFNHYNSGSSDTMNPLPYLIVLGAIINTGVGIIIWTSGSIEKNKYKRAMDITNPKVNLSLNANNNGIGVKLNF